MSVTYNITNEKGETESQLRAPCFSSHYGSLANWSSMVYRIPKYYALHSINWQDGTCLPCTVDDVETYLRLIKEMGLNFSMRTDENDYLFDIPLKENTIMHNKMILNCLRYLGEDNFPSIVRWLVRFSKEQVDNVNTYTKLVIAHDNRIRGNTNHMFVPWYTFALPMSDEEVKRLILDNDKNGMLNFVIKSCKTPFGGDLTVLRSLFTEDASFKDIYKKYKELCEKYT